MAVNTSGLRVGFMWLIVAGATEQLRKLHVNGSLAVTSVLLVAIVDMALMSGAYVSIWLILCVAATIARCCGSVCWFAIGNDAYCGDGAGWSRNCAFAFIVLEIGGKKQFLKSLNTHTGVRKVVIYL